MALRKTRDRGFLVRSWVPKEEVCLESDVIISASVWPRMGAHNLFMPTLGSPERGGIVRNDRHIRFVTPGAARRHRQSEADEIVRMGESKNGNA